MLSRIKLFFADEYLYILRVKVIEYYYKYYCVEFLYHNDDHFMEILFQYKCYYKYINIYLLQRDISTFLETNSFYIISYLIALSNILIL